MSFILRAAFFAIFSFYLVSCQTSPVKDFEQVQVGMDKNKVLHLMGSPTTAFRFSGKDRWVYKMYENDVRYIKEVHFMDDHAVYVGDEHQPQPEQQALVIDQRNAQEEIKIAEQEVQKKTDLEKSYQEYQQKSKLEDKVRYLPRFEPIR